MWSSIASIFKKAIPFAAKNLGGTRKVSPAAGHMASKKFSVVATSLVALMFFYFASVGILFFLPDQSGNNEIITGFVAIFTKTIEVLAIIIASYLGVQAAVDLRFGSNSNVNYESHKEIGEDKDDFGFFEKTVKYNKIYSDDESYAPIDWIKSHGENKDV
jgi:hypothetical protein